LSRLKKINRQFPQLFNSLLDIVKLLFSGEKKRQSEPLPFFDFKLFTKVTKA